MKLGELWRIALLHCPLLAMSWSIATAEWGLAHELAHALLASPRERRLRLYGLPFFNTFEIDPDTRKWKRPFLVEASATWLSGELHRRCGRFSLVADERLETDAFSLSLIGTPAMQAFVRRRGCSAIPSTADGLIALCRRRGLRSDPRRIHEYRRRRFPAVVLEASGLMSVQ